MASRGLLIAYGSYVSYYQSSLLAGYSSTDIAWPGTLQAVLIIAVGVLTGPLFDRGYIRSLLLVGSFLVVFGMMMLSLSSEYYQIILAQGVCVGIGSGLVYVPSLAMVTFSMSPKNRPLGLACVTNGVAIGGVIYPIALQNLLPLVGFGWATRILGFIALFTFAVGITCVLWHGPGLEPQAPRSFIDMSALKEPQFLAFLVAIFFIFLAYFIPFFYIPTYAEVRVRSSTDFSVYLLAISNAATLPARFVAALAAQRYGALNILLACTTLSTIVLFCWFGVFSLAGFDVWVLGWGLAAGALNTLPAAVVPQLCPSMDIVGTRMGMLWFSAAMGVLVGAPVFGVLSDLPAMDFTRAQGFTAATMAAAAILVLLMRTYLMKPSQS